jgi:hypothetical protein
VGFFDDTDLRDVTMGVAAIGAELGIANVVAERAKAEAIFDVEQGLGEALGVLAGLAENMKRQALRGLLAHAGKALEFLNQPLEGLSKVHNLQDFAQRIRCAKSPVS